MDKIASDIPILPTSTMSLADAEGVPGRKPSSPLRWYVALVMHNTEKACAAKVATLFQQQDAGSPYVETYIPIQKEKRVWRNGRKKEVERVLCPCYLFIRCTEDTRKRIKASAPFINSFIKDRAMPANAYGQTPFAHIPDKQMQSFMRMVRYAESQVTIDTSALKAGDRVRVNGGPLKGMEGYLLAEPSGGTSLAIRIDILGSAKVDMPIAQLERIM